MLDIELKGLLAAVAAAGVPDLGDLPPQAGRPRDVQNHAIIPEVAAQMQALRGTSEPFDGVAAISFATPEDLARGNTDPLAAEAQKLLAADEAKFIDIGRSAILLEPESTNIQIGSVV